MDEQQGGDTSGSCSLVYRGGRTIPDLSFKTFYFGSMWRQDPASGVVNRHAQARVQIDRALAAAMNDPALNAIVQQYFPDGPIGTTVLPSDIIDAPARTARPNVPFNEIDVRRTIADLVANRLDDVDLQTTAINIVLPQGMCLEILGLDEQERPASATVGEGVPSDTPFFGSGLAGFHGSVALQRDGRPIEVLYSVTAWSDGSIGIPVPGWSGWENITATLYHELQEIRTNPDVDCAVRTGNAALIGWNSHPVKGPDGMDHREIADLPLLLQSGRPYGAFSRVAVTDQDGAALQAPIQLLWSNQHRQIMPCAQDVAAT